MTMNKDNIQRLIQRFNAGEASANEILEIEALLEAGLVDISDFDNMNSLQEQIDRVDPPSPSPTLDRRFHEMLARHKREEGTSRGERAGAFLSRIFTLPASWAPRLAMATVALLIGIVAGYLLRQPSATSGDARIAALSHQVTELQEMIMLSLLEKGSATERLKAVSLTQQMDEASRKVTNALIHTLNNDENINVRLAALEALKPYAGDSSVREALVRAIANQESPLVQVSLAELMVALQEKAAAREFERIVESDKTPDPVKKKLRESIEVLI